MPGNVELFLSSVITTSARLTAAESSLPLKTTSSIFLPRRALTRCSPIAQRIASTTFDLPQPLGPTIALTPLEKSMTTLSRNDLKPDISNRFNFINGRPTTCLRIWERLTKEIFFVKRKYNKMYWYSLTPQYVVFFNFLHSFEVLRKKRFFGRLKYALQGGLARTAVAELESIEPDLVAVALNQMTFTI